MSKGTDAAAEATATEASEAASHDSNDELRKAAEKRSAAAELADAATRGDERGFVQR